MIINGQNRAHAGDLGGAALTADQPKYMVVSSDNGVRSE
jgi:hypothetical protein